MSERQEANYKSLKGYFYFSSGWVEKVWVTEVASSFIYTRGLVYQSYPSASKQPYPVYACLSSTGKVFKAQCKCVAGLGESCSHVTALLFYLEDAVRLRRENLPDDVTCTDQTKCLAQAAKELY